MKKYCVCLCALMLGVEFAHGQPSAITINPDLKIEEAIRKIEEDDLENARRDIQEVFRINRKHEKLKLAQGLFNLKIGMTTDALPHLVEYNKTPEGMQDHRGHAALGRMYQSSKMYNVAISHLNSAKRVAPTGMVNGKNVKADIILDLALCYHGLAKHKQALDEARQAEQLAGTDPVVQLKLAEVALSAKDYDVAMKAAETSISLFSNRISTEPLNKKNYEQLMAAHRFKVLVGIEQAKAQPREAKPTFDVAIATRDAAEVQRLLGLIEARDIVAKALEKDAKDSPLATTMKLFMAKAELNLRAFQDADEHVAEILRTDPNNREAQELRRQISGGAVGAKLP